MAQTCDFCGKNRHKAHKVSHSNIKTRKWQQPNLQSIRAWPGPPGFGLHALHPFG
jgi:ribosomal protein L28